MIDDDMLIINIIYTTKMEATKQREKLRFLTRESMHMNLLSKYGEVVLQQVVKRMKEREPRMRQQEEDDDDDD